MSDVRMRHQQTGEERNVPNEGALEALMEGFRPVEAGASVVGEIVDENGDPEIIDVPIDRLVPTAQAGAGAFSLPSAERLDLIRAFREEERLEEEFGDPTVQFAQERFTAGGTVGLSDLAAEQGGTLGSRFQQFLSNQVGGLLVRPAEAIGSLAEGDLGGAAEQLAGAASLGVSDFLFAEPEDPESFRERREQMSMRNPVTATTATIGGALAGALLGARVPLPVAGPIGGTVKAGESFRRWANAGLQSRGMGQVGAGLLSRAGAGAIEGGLVEAGFSTTRQLLENKSLSAEQLVADAGLGMALGIGFDAALFGGQRALRALGRRMSRSGGSELLAGDRLEALNRSFTQGDISPEEFLRHVKRNPQDVPGSIWTRTKARIGSILGGADSEDLVALGDRVVRTDAVDFESNAGRLGGELAGSANKLNNLFEELTQQARGRIRLSAFADDFASLPAAQTMSAARRELHSLRGQIADARENVVLQKADRSLLKDLDEAISEAEVRSVVDQEIAALSPEQAGRRARRVYESLLDAESIAQTNLARAKGKDRFSEQVRMLAADTASRLNNLAKDESIWGRVGRAQASRDTMFHEVLSWRDAVAQVGGRRTRGLEESVGRTKRAFDAERMSAALRKMGDPEGGEPVWNYFMEYGSAIQRNMDEFARNFDVDQAKIREIRTANKEMLETLARNARKAQAYEIMNRALRAENQASGFAGASGFLGGAGLGALAGLGPVGTGLAGLGVGALVRPASGYRRLAQLDKLVGSQANRLTKLRSKLRQAFRGTLPKRISSAGFIDPIVQEVQNSEEAFFDVREELLTLQENPEALMDRIGASYNSVASLDEGVADELSSTAVNGLAYLTQHLPPVVTDPLTGQPMGPPSRTEMDSFMLRFRAAHDPFVLLEDFIEGHLAVETAETVRTIFPQIFAIQGSILTDEMIGAGEIPYQIRSQVSTLFGIEADPTFSPDFLAAMSNQGYQTEQQEQAIRGPRPSSRKPDLASHTLSVSQTLETGQI